MARRSNPNPRSADAHLESLRALLDNFELELQQDDLRSKVRSLIPVFHEIRDLGSSLLSSDLRQSGRDRIIQYFLRFPRVVIDGEELMVVAGIDDWGRRIRELRREFGWNIISGVTAGELTEADEVGSQDLSLTGMRPNDYMLLSDVQDREAAHRWNTANQIRRGAGSVQSKILRYFRENVGRPVTGEELRYVANDKKEWARRVRELRTDDGWPVYTRNTGRRDLPVGVYVLEEDRQAPAHDRKIADAVRVEVLARDEYRCANPTCRWDPRMPIPGDPRHTLELHHVIHHVDQGPNTSDNLTTVCNVCHDRIHSGELTVTWS